MLEIQNLEKQYQNFSLHCSLKVKAGQVTGLIGKNGAGKSTTFKAILDIIQADQGTIKFFGKSVQTLTGQDKQKIGVVLSDSGFSEYLRIKDIAAILKGMYPHFDEAFFKRQIQRFQLPTNQRIKDFSTGMKAKLKVLIALSHQAQLLILDEPTVGLDVIARDELLEMLREFMEENEDHAILISSHISKDLERLCDDLYMIDEGKIILHEDTDILLSQYALLKVDLKQYETLDKRFILRVKKEPYGYCCLTNEKPYYLENYPNIAIENCNIDETITMMIRGQAK